MKSRNVILIGFSLVIMLLVSFLVGSFVLRESQDTDIYLYHGRTDNFSFQIVKTKDVTSHVLRVYTVEKGIQHEKLIPFDYDPRELIDIPLEQELFKKVLGINIAKSLIYITQDPKLPNQTSLDSVVAVQEIAKVTGTASYSVFMIETRAAYTYDDNSTKLAEFVDCRFANSRIGVILLQVGQENRIYSEDNCVIVEGKNGKDLRKMATKLSYHLLGLF